MKTFTLANLAILGALSQISLSTPVLEPSAATVLKSVGVDTANFTPKAGDASSTCKILYSLYPKNDTFTSSSTYYTPLYEEPWSQTCWLEPACIVTPANAQEVSVIVKVLTILKTKFAVRSGGHKASPGFAGVGRDGVLIALQNLNQLALTLESKTMKVGTGNRWRDVYEYGEKNNVIVVGGRVPMVGVGGFTLGGGVSLFVNTYGLSIDLVTRFQIVLMDGRIVDATPLQNPDLFKGLKGGMSNFGIITEFEFQTKPTVDAYYSVVTYTLAQTADLLKAYGEYLSDPSIDPKGSVEVQFNGNITTVFYGWATLTSAPKDFDRFSKLPSAQTLIPPTNGSLVNVILQIGGSETTLGNWVGQSFSHKVKDGKLMQETLALIQEASKKLKPKMYLTYVPQGILPNVVKIGQANGGNYFGIEPTPQVWIDLYMTFADVQDTDFVTALVADLVNQITQKAEAAGLLLPFVFPSTASQDQKVLRGFGDQNFHAIRSVARKYDPKGYMQTLQNDGYLFSRE